jgi:hypothetical protein
MFSFIPLQIWLTVSKLDRFGHYVPNHKGQLLAIAVGDSPRSFS